MDAIFAAKLTALSTVLAACGYYTCSSQNPAVILLSQPASVSTPFFTSMYYRGAAVVGPAAVIATTSFGYLAYASADPNKRKMYGASAVLSMAALPWTALVMAGGIDRLISIGKDPALQVTAGSSGEVTKLLKTWTAQNYVRVGFTLAAGLIGLSASL